MVAIELTKDSDALICLLYKAYCEKRENGILKSDAKFMGNSATIQASIVPKWTLVDTDETCRELHRAGLLDCDYADDVVCRSLLSDSSIIYMETRFERNVNKLLEYIKKLPFV